MRGGVMPPALLFAALAFALAFAPRRVLLPGLAALVLVAAAIHALPIPKAWTEAVFVGCWLSVIGTAAMVHLRAGAGPRLAFALAVNAGAWAGATVAVSGVGLDLLKAFAVLVLLVPARWLVAHRGGIAVKVVASWLVAVAILAATLATMPTPGYVPDHME